MAPAFLCPLKVYEPSATVGVVSFPNIGKSSLINTLKTGQGASSCFPVLNIYTFSTFDDACIVVGKACAVAAQPGHTVRRSCSQFKLERGLRIVDSGVIFEDDDSIQDQKESSVILRNKV
ncbi:hypothetical protein F5888DRAFT_1206078 [Russula emetica]|nr:hypothetical protein F5888DRAFT_1206078 [Russula emetica]